MAVFVAAQDENVTFDTADGWFVDKEGNLHVIDKAEVKDKHVGVFASGAWIFATTRTADNG